MTTIPAGRVGGRGLGTMVVLFTAFSFASCFRSPDAGKIKCIGPSSCPPKNTCIIKPGEAYGKCQAGSVSPDGGHEDAAPGDAGKPTDGPRSPDGWVATDATSDQQGLETRAPDSPATAPEAGTDPDVSPPADGVVGPDVRPPDVASDTVSARFDVPPPDVPIPGPEVATGCTSATDCTGTCQTCSNRTCVTVTNQADPSGHCQGTCDSSGSCKATGGQVCQAAAECAAGLSCAPDGHCCDRACAGPCESCETGTCKPVTGAPHTGHGGCAGSATECAGSCTGATNGQCTWPNTACGQSTCTTLTNTQSQPTGTTYTPQGACNTGTCSPASATSCAGSLICATNSTCKTSCATDADCLVGNACTAGVCGGKKGVGTACSANNQCQSDSCVDGFCCESACTGKCVACSRAKTGVADGYCRDVTTGTDPDNDCAVDNTNPCGLDGTCGSGGACRFQPASLSCGTASCTGQGTYTPKGTCDGAGTCQAGTPGQCAGHMPCASATTCATTCTANSTTGCPTGYKCATTGTSCVLATMQCGGTACPLANGGGQCCITGEIGGPYTETCLPPGSTCSGSGMTCHSKVDCPNGQVCCASRSACVVGSTRCVLPTDSLCQDGGMSSADRFCDYTVSPSECPSGTSCVADAFGSCGPNDIYICQ